MSLQRPHRNLPWVGRRGVLVFSLIFPSRTAVLPCSQKVYCTLVAPPERVQHLFKSPCLRQRNAETEQRSDLVKCFHFKSTFFVTQVLHSIVSILDRGHFREWWAIEMGYWESQQASVALSYFQPRGSLRLFTYVQASTFPLCFRRMS